MPHLPLLPDGIGIGMAAGLVLAAVLSAAFWLYRRQAADVRSAILTARETVEEHLDALARRRAMLVRIDDYGVVDERRWQREIAHFVENVIRPRFTARELRALGAGPWIDTFMRDEIEGQVLARSSDLESANQALSALSPAAFEASCAQALTSLGWRARTTQATGDQGADIIAERNGVRLVVQCKLVRRPVGNKAVQEAFAAREHFGAHHAAVVTNSAFTRSAHELAATTRVHLLHHSQLADLDRLGETGRPA